MPGHLLLYHPGVLKLKELVDAGELGDVLCVYGNRQNLGTIRKDENALWSLGVHDLSVILYLSARSRPRPAAHGNAFLTPGVEDVVFCYLRFPSGKIAHMHLSWLDPHKMRKHHRRRPREDGRLRRHGARAQGDGLREGAREPRRDLRRVAHAHRRHLQPEDRRTTSRCGSSARHFLDLVRDGAGDRREARDGLVVVRTLERLQDVAGRGGLLWPRSTRRRSSIPGTVLGEGVKVLEGAVVGKQPTLSPRSTAKREPLPPAELGDGTIVSTGAIVFAGHARSARA